MKSSGHHCTSGYASALCTGCKRILYNRRGGLGARAAWPRQLKIGGPLDLHRLVWHAACPFYCSGAFEPCRVASPSCSFTDPLSRSLFFWFWGKFLSQSTAVPFPSLLSSSEVPVAVDCSAFFLSCCVHQWSDSRLVRRLAGLSRA